VWDSPERNPWATIPTRALIELGYSSPPDPSAPGMFALSDSKVLAELIEEAGFVDVRIESLPTPRSAASAEAFIEETIDLSFMFAGVYTSLPVADQARVRERIAEMLQPFTGEDGSVELPGSAIGAVADA
jgi:hypothetical protein